MLVRRYLRSHSLMAFWAILHPYLALTDRLLRKIEAKVRFLEDSAQTHEDHAWLTDRSGLQLEQLVQKVVRWLTHRP